MLASQRRALILDLIKKNQFISVSELSLSLDASEATIRRDLNSLELEGKLERTHGGASAIENLKYEEKMDEKQAQNIKEKMAIATQAFALLKDHQTIILDAGSTTQLLARLIGESTLHLTIITNATNHFPELTKNPNVECYLIGGKIRSTTLACVGSLAVSSMSRFKADIAFLGVNGISAQGEFTTADVEESLMKRSMLERASKVVVLSDHSKFKRVWFSVFANAHEVDLLICDQEGDQDFVKQLEKNYQISIKIASQPS
jgi:DeoR family transcriptional regulator, fructose operon transcriptional repressor